MGLADTIQVWEYESEEQLVSVMPVNIGKAHRNILQALAVFPYFTAEQISRYLSLSLRYTQDNLKTLSDAKYVLPLTPTKQLHAGSVPYVYTLGAKGRKYVAMEGLEDVLVRETEDAEKDKFVRFRPSEERRKTFTLLHSLAVNELLLQAKLLARTEESITLSGYVKERGFEVSPLSVTLKNGERARIVSLSPDLWLDFEYGDYRYCFCVEVNLTPVEQKRWRQKIRAYLNSTGVYEKRFGTDILVIVTLIETPLNFPKANKRATLTPFEKTQYEETQKARSKRLTDMIRWTERELSARNVKSASDHFLFSTLDLNSTRARDIFLVPQFLTPFSKRKESLIPLTDKEAEA